MKRLEQRDNVLVPGFARRKLTLRVLDKQALRKLLAWLCLRKQASSGIEIGKQASNLGCLFACLRACLI
jgi:hypothetical protein